VVDDRSHAVGVVVQHCDAATDGRRRLDDQPLDVIGLRREIVLGRQHLPYRIDHCRDQRAFPRPVDGWPAHDAAWNGGRAELGDRIHRAVGLTQRDQVGQCLAVLLGERAQFLQRPGRIGGQAPVAL
jgi:hypothetical protein